MYWVWVAAEINAGIEAVASIELIFESCPLKPFTVTVALGLRPLPDTVTVAPL